MVCRVRRRSATCQSGEGSPHSKGSAPSTLSRSTRLLVRRKTSDLRLQAFDRPTYALGDVGESFVLIPP